MKKATILAIATVTALSFGPLSVSAQKKKGGKRLSGPEEARGNRPGRAKEEGQGAKEQEGRGKGKPLLSLTTSVWPRIVSLILLRTSLAKAPGYFCMALLRCSNNNDDDDDNNYN